MVNNEEENIMVGEDIPIQHENPLLNTEIEEGDEVNDDTNEEKLIEDDER